MPPYLFEKRKLRIVVEIILYELNEKRTSTFRKKCNYFTNDSSDLNLVWKTKKVSSFFPLKDKNFHPSCKTFYGLCSCEDDCVGETKRNVPVRYDEHKKPSKKSKPSAHLEQKTLTIISLQGFYVMHHQMLEHVRILRRFP